VSSITGFEALALAALVATVAPAVIVYRRRLNAELAGALIEKLTREGGHDRVINLMTFNDASSLCRAMRPAFVKAHELRAQLELPSAGYRARRRPDERAISQQLTALFDEHLALERAYLGKWRWLAALAVVLALASFWLQVAVGASPEWWSIGVACCRRGRADRRMCQLRAGLGICSEHHARSATMAPSRRDPGVAWGLRRWNLRRARRLGLPRGRAMRRRHAPGAVVAVAAGSYTEDLQIHEPVRIWGRWGSAGHRSRTFGAVGGPKHPCRPGHARGRADRPRGPAADGAAGVVTRRSQLVQKRRMRPDRVARGLARGTARHRRLVWRCGQGWPRRIRWVSFCSSEAGW
jgi:hypothetical protein